MPLLGGRTGRTRRITSSSPRAAVSLRCSPLFFSTSVPSPKQQHRINDARRLLLCLRSVAQAAVTAASNRPDLCLSGV